MSKPKVYADFQNADDSNRLRLTCAGTFADLARQNVELHEGLVLTFYADDADDQGNYDELRIEGVVHFDERDRIWVASVDWSAVRHQSDEGKSNGGIPGPSVLASTDQNGPTNQSGAPFGPTVKQSR